MKDVKKGASTDVTRSVLFYLWSALGAQNKLSLEPSAEDAPFSNAAPLSQAQLPSCSCKCCCKDPSASAAIRSNCQIRTAAFRSCAWTRADVE